MIHESGQGEVFEHAWPYLRGGQGRHGLILIGKCSVKSHEQSALSWPCTRKLLSSRISWLRPWGSILQMNRVLFKVGVLHESLKNVSPTTTASCYTLRHGTMSGLLSPARANALSDIMLDLLARHSPSSDMSEISITIRDTIRRMLLANSQSQSHLRCPIPLSTHVELLSTFTARIWLSYRPYLFRKISEESWSALHHRNHGLLATPVSILLKYHLPLRNATSPWIDQMQWSARCRSTPKQRPSVR